MFISYAVPSPATNLSYLFILSFCSVGYYVLCYVRSLVSCDNDHPMLCAYEAACVITLIMKSCFSIMNVGF